MRRKSPSTRIMSRKPKNRKPGRTTQSAASTKKTETARHGLNDTGKTMTLRETTAMDRMISMMESQGKRRTTRTYQKTSHTTGGLSTTRDLLTMGNLTRSGLLTTTRAPTTIRTHTKIRACTTKKRQKSPKAPNQVRMRMSMRDTSQPRSIKFPGQKSGILVAIVKGRMSRKMGRIHTARREEPHESMEGSTKMDAESSSIPHVKMDTPKQTNVQTGN